MSKNAYIAISEAEVQMDRDRARVSLPMLMDVDATWKQRIDGVMACLDMAFYEREPHEPRMRRRAGNFCGAGLAGDRRRAGAKAASGAVEHHVAHEAAERPRGVSRQELLRRRSGSGRIKRARRG